MTYYAAANTDLKFISRVVWGRPPLVRSCMETRGLGPPNRPNAHKIVRISLLLALKKVWRLWIFGSVHRRVDASVRAGSKLLHSGYMCEDSLTRGQRNSKEAVG